MEGVVIAVIVISWIFSTVGAVVAVAFIAINSGNDKMAEATTDYYVDHVCERYRTQMSVEDIKYWLKVGNVHSRHSYIYHEEDNTLEITMFGNGHKQKYELLIYDINDSRIIEVRFISLLQQKGRKTWYKPWHFTEYVGKLLKAERISPYEPLPKEQMNIQRRQ